MSKNTKPLVVFVTLSLEEGPILTNNIKLANKFVFSNINVSLLCLQNAEENAIRLIPETVKVSVFGCQRFRNMIPAMWRYLRQEKVSAIFVSGSLQGIICVFCSLFLMNRPHIVLRTHTTSSLYLKSRSSFFDRYILKYAMMVFYRFADEVVAVSNFAARDLENLIGVSRGYVHVLHNPVVTDEVSILSGETINHPWLLDKEGPVLIAIGRLEPEKDYFTLLRAIKKVLQFREVKLIILGKGSLVSDLKTFVCDLGIQDCVDFVGYVDNPYAYLAKSDLLVLTSAYEGLPNVVVEALACGCPVVSTRSGGSAEILSHRELGLLVPVGDDAAVAEAVLSVLAEKRDVNVLQARALDFHIDVIWPSFVAVSGTETKNWIQAHEKNPIEG